MSKCEGQAPGQKSQTAEAKAETAFDVFGSDLSDDVFEGVFDQPRQRIWHELDL